MTTALTRVSFGASFLINPQGPLLQQSLRMTALTTKVTSELKPAVRNRAIERTTFSKRIVLYNRSDGLAASFVPLSNPTKDDFPSNSLIPSCS